MADELKEGQEVSWKWGSGNPSGKVAEIVADGKAEVTSQKVNIIVVISARRTLMMAYQGNTVSRHGKGDDDPAVKITRSGNDVVKLAHELNEVKDAQ
ncbi:hypothetical protein EUX98_g2933 [Antrodiella citrinella]|uniref:Hypervirulence associated protein TUDOR domain-containing protein n=1 Tax=Antrodiella citrinella TaxID=2447956 RepID=A0A4S4MXV8_9APHY|nr:hypothetical protein EUX98_g2933 [Antrodiella citrinella]